MLRNKAVEEGLGNLTRAEKTTLLRDARSMTALHDQSLRARDASGAAQ
jgi:hypothetical protein